MLFGAQEKKKDGGGTDDGWFDPFGPTFPEKDKPTSPADVEIPESPSEEGEGDTAEMLIQYGIPLVIAILVCVLIYNKLRGHSAVPA